MWSARDWAEIAVLRSHEGGIFVASFLSDGRRIVTGSDDRTARLWSSPPDYDALFRRATGIAEYLPPHLVKDKCNYYQVLKRCGQFK
ncbi:MAG: WD40 repeat domain-containing protein [Pikeienuella sp.]